MLVLCAEADRKIAQLVGRLMGGGGDRRRPRGISEEDAALWRYVTRDVRRADSKSRVAQKDLQNEPAERRAASSHPASRKPTEAGRLQHAVKPPAKPQGGPHSARDVVEEPRLVVLERRKARRLARGGIDIDARLDLHGMTQDEAHVALSRFLHRAAADGLKTVLIITGKGGVAGRGGARHGTDSAVRERGVLRRNVPLWLGTPQLRGLVSSYATAHVRHGGEGALYVMLRRVGA